MTDRDYVTVKVEREAWKLLKEMTRLKQVDVAREVTLGETVFDLLLYRENLPYYKNRKRRQLRF